MSIPGGYFFRPSRYTPSIGHAGLDVVLTNSLNPPAGTIRAATFSISAPLPSPRTFHATNNENPEAEEFRVCAGNFRLVRDNHKVIQGFCFGGQLFAHNERNATICRLESTAPIYQMAYELSWPQAFVVSEFLAILARVRAAWRNDTAFGQRLATADPFQLFIAMLAALDDFLGRFHDSVWVEDYRRGRRLVRQTIATLQASGAWPAAPPALDDIIGPDD